MEFPLPDTRGCRSEDRDVLYMTAVILFRVVENVVSLKRALILMLFLFVLMFKPRLIIILSKLSSDQQKNGGIIQYPPTGPALPAQ
ncbi:uncharacterized [Tachysurus ichikawai]